MTVVIDASLALKWALQEEHTEDALALWDRWQEASERVIAPPIFRSEVTNVLHRRTRRGDLNATDALDVLDLLITSVAIGEPADLYGRALTIARDLALGSTYDVLYLALAEAEGCEMWTADRAFVRSAQERFRQVRWIAERP